MEKTFALGRVRSSDGAVKTVLVVDGVLYDLAALHAASGSTGAVSDMRPLLQDWARAFAELNKLVDTMDSLDKHVVAAAVLPDEDQMISPLPRPGKVMCAAANYAAHVAEMAKTGFTGPKGAQQHAPQRPKAPYHFLKATSCSAGPFDDILLPSPDHRIDWEIELTAVIGRPAKSVPMDNAMDHVAGYVVVNDVSCRAATWREDRPNIRSDWLSGKSYDTFLPTGPYFLPAKFVPDYRKLRLQLWVNGEMKQDGLADDMIFSLEEQIVYLSKMLTLESGDLIATGTPAGVGQGSGAFLKPGDVVEAEISGMGRQRNGVSLHPAWNAAG